MISFHISAQAFAALKQHAHYEDPQGYECHCGKSCCFSLCRIPCAAFPCGAFPCACADSHVTQFGNRSPQAVLDAESFSEALNDPARSQLDPETVRLARAVALAAGITGALTIGCCILSGALVYRKCAKHTPLAQKCDRFLEILTLNMAFVRDSVTAGVSRAGGAAARQSCGQPRLARPKASFGAGIFGGWWVSWQWSFPYLSFWHKCWSGLGFGEWTWRSAPWRPFTY